MLEAQQAPLTGEVIVMAESEHLLLTLVRQRDELAFKRLYDRHLGKVYGLCLRMTGNRSMAEEATQEVFIQLWRKIDTFAGDSSFSTWLHSITTNTTLSYLRKQKNWLRRMVASDDYEALAAQLEASQDADPAALDACLARLPERARLVFVLHAMEGYRQETIATLMGITTGTVKAQYHRARHLLEAWLSEDIEEKHQ